MKRLLLALTLLALLLLAAPAQAAWTYTVRLNLSRGGSLPRIVQAQFVEKSRGWTTLVTRDDLPSYTTLKQIQLWCDQRIMLLDKLAAAYDDAQARIGARVTQGNWTATLRAREDVLQPEPALRLTFLVANATLKIEREAVYEITKPAEYSIVNLSKWLKEWLARIDADVATKTVPVTPQAALDATVQEAR